MDNLGSPYGSENPNASAVLGANERKNDTMMYSANASSIMLRNAKGNKVESEIQLF